MTHQTYQDECSQPLQQSYTFPTDRTAFCESDIHQNYFTDDARKCRREEARAHGCGSCSRAAGRLRWSILPILIGVTSAAGFVATYFIAKNQCHIEKWILPYLSYTGTEYPESMIFGLILNTEGFLGLIVVFLAWRYYQHMGQTGYFNHITLLFGGLSCFGVIIVGNFQVTKAQVPHYIGAGLAFIVGTGYGILTSISSKRLLKRAKPTRKFAPCVVYIRIGIAVTMVLCLSCLTVVGISKKVSVRNKTQEVRSNVSLTSSNSQCPEVMKNVPAYVRNTNLLGAIMEWVLTACLLLCLSLFAYEFQTFQRVKVLLKLRTVAASSIRGYAHPMTSRSSSIVSPYQGNEVPAGRAATHLDGSALTDQYQSTELQCDANETKPKTQSPDSSSQSLIKHCLHNTTADSGIGDDVPLVNNRRFSRSRNLAPTVKYSRSLPNIAAVETV